MPQDCNTQRDTFWPAGIKSIHSWLTANQRRDRSPHHCPNVACGNWNCQQKLLGHRGVRGESGSAAFTPAEEAPAAPWSLAAPLPLPLARLFAARSLPLANFRVPLQMVSRCKLRYFRAFPRARPLPPARAPRTHTRAHAHTHTHTHARTHALPGEGRAAASTACSRHTINNNRFLRSGLASRSPASGGGGGRGAGSVGPGALPNPPRASGPGPLSVSGTPKPPQGAA